MQEVKENPVHTCIAQVQVKPKCSGRIAVKLLLFELRRLGAGTSLWCRIVTFVHYQECKISNRADLMVTGAWEKLKNICFGFFFLSDS